MIRTFKGMMDGFVAQVLFLKPLAGFLVELL
jgi:hypothetical protein